MSNVNEATRRTRQEIREDYEGFVEKFKSKLTTDDCMTPPAVYDAVLDWLRERVDLAGREIVRPFWPGGDYEAYEYPEGCAVVDNPPFSIITKIARFYQSRGIRFFLFAPHLTLFSSKDADWTQIITGARIVYNNKAVVDTAFISNLFGDVRIMTAPDLYTRIDRLRRQGRESKWWSKCYYPANIITVSRLERLVMRGQEIVIPGHAVTRVSALDAQRPAGKRIFGAGYLCSDTAERQIALAEQAAREQAVRGGVTEYRWELSEREHEIVETLNLME